MEIKLSKSSKAGKKMMVVISDNGRSKTVHFGASGLMDFTKYSSQDPQIAEEKKRAYIARHSKAGETWTKDGVKTAGFWAKHILWNKPTISASVADTNRRFGLNIKY